MHNSAYSIMETPSRKPLVWIGSSFKDLLGIATPKHELDLIRARLRRAEEFHRGKGGAS